MVFMTNYKNFDSFEEDYTTEPLIENIEEKEESEKDYSGYSHTPEELATWQKYPLSLKMGLTRTRILELAENYDFYVSFSGGKDSEVAVDYVAKVLSMAGYRKMYVLNVRTGLEYKSVMDFCKPFCEYVSKKYGIEIIMDYVYPEMAFHKVLRQEGYPIISKEVSKCIREARKGLANGDGTYQYRLDKLNGTHRNKDGSLSQYNCPKYKFLLDAKFRISEVCCKKVKKNPAIAYEKRTGRIPLIATMASESRLRRTNWLRHGCNAFDLKRPTAAPFSFWVDNDMLQYIHDNNLPIADAYGKIVPENKTGFEGQLNLFDETGYEGCKYTTTGCKRTGCLYCLFGITEDPKRILRLQSLEPKRADYVLRGGEFDEEGMWVPNKEGLGYWYIIDWLALYGIHIPYQNKEKYRKFKVEM